ncbi:putative cystathionine gamma-lyase 2 [Trichoplusia ni]|uniref:cystathionine gamma-lyase n=1 Tax=Trichoplusia ni TaxID=7111 RepID=A0A7E5WGV1_TRINI|nr:putative cystathionine gamma-lyase 2 [Trichoplusia ni]
MKSSIIGLSINHQRHRGRVIAPYLTQIGLRRMSSQKDDEDDFCGFLEQKPGYSTAAVHVAQEPEKQGGAVVPPITMSSTFKFKSLTEPFNTYIYGRLGNPVRNTLEEVLAALEGGKIGFTFASGMGAISAVSLLLGKGDHLITSEDVYGGTYTLFSEFTPKLGVEVSMVDVSEPGVLEKTLKKNTKMVYFETPTNPSIKVIDIEETVKKVKKFDNKIMVVVDNTFLGSYLQRPLDFGADIVLYSLSKFMNGNSDVILGGVIVNDPAIGDRLRFIQRIVGIIPSPFDCYLVNRSLKTLAIRMERHKMTTLAIARWLECHPNIKEVMHPGLKSHKQRNIAKKQSTGHSGVFSFRHCGDVKVSEKLCTSLKIFTLAVSLGGHESLVQIPSQMTHKLVPDDVKKRLGITDEVIRVSVGLEDCEDLIEDLDQGLKIAFGK